MKNENKHTYSFSATITINGDIVAEAGNESKAKEKVRETFEGHHTIKDLTFEVFRIHKLEIQG